MRRWVITGLALLALSGCGLVSRSGRSPGGGEISSLPAAVPAASEFENKLQIGRREVVPVSQGDSHSTVRVGGNLINNSPYEVTKTVAIVTLLDENRRELFRQKVTYDQFEDELIGYAGSLAPRGHSVAMVELSIPNEILQEFKSYWIQIVEVHGYPDNNEFTTVGHLMTAFAGPKATTTCIKVRQKPALAETVDASTGIRVVHAAAAGMVGADFFDWLAQRGLDLKAKTRSGATALHFAATSGNPGAVDYLVSKGLSLSARDNAGNLPAHYAAERSPGIFLILVDKYKVKPTVKNGDGVAAVDLYFMYRTVTDKPDEVRWLVERGLDPNHPIRGMPLIVHCLTDPELFEWLLDRGANPNAEMVKRWTLLHATAKGGDFELVKTLLAHGANPNARSEGGNTPADIARKYKHTDCERVLRAAQKRRKS